MKNKMRKKSGKKDKNEKTENKGSGKRMKKQAMVQAVIAAFQASPKESFNYKQISKILGLEAQVSLVLTTNGRLPSRLEAEPMLFNHAVAVVWVDGRLHVLDGTLRGQVRDGLTPPTARQLAIAESPPLAEVVRIDTGGVRRWRVAHPRRSPWGGSYVWFCELVRAFFTCS